MIPDLVIFDCDGVLVDSEPISNQTIADALSEMGVSCTLEETMAAFVGKSMAQVAEGVRAMGAELPGSDADWIDSIYAQTYARLRAGVDPIPGVTAVLDALDAAGVPYCVASNGSDEKMDITLGATGMAERFRGKRFSAQTLGVSKPDPDLFFIAAQYMSTVPGRAVVIEDSASGALGAQRAGMRCFGYAPTDGAALEAVGAEIFRSMDQLPALLGLPH
ncbi:HAD family hydrolase [Gymnodinialimonas ceratoperidinii]|uniref:HAD-IA family hydrolase n=1 Tax=Gymnodinialimonas ceratoperidinii TaxID=2856823 RepID=A0A8F6TXK3_9RHOB|nr:HAD-IA family hydrolase [Gymnodinialimonas ceratoperidinii]QXT39783.1 HAD-IA family hydrolase [Gymnodinialimonas ceratoperidinii]